MGSEFFHQKMEGQQNLREQLASVVRSIQWSYAIFWSPSSSQSGALEWGEGYYNGDIKTRKTILAMEINNTSDQMGCQRSDQLRELYDSLLSGGADTANAQPRRPSAALSPEDLTNAEWYYLVCMSFVFRIDQGLPGKSLANNGKPIWLSNAHCADTRVFCRSLLAKSAAIKTVVCFQFLSGVIELGVTDLVQEDLDLILRVKTTFLDQKNNYSYPSILPQKLDDYSFSQLRDEAFLHVDLPSLMQDDYLDTGLPNNAFLVEEEAASQAQSWQLNEEELSNCVHTSMTSSDCISQTFVNRENMNAPNYLLDEELVEDHPQTSEDLNYKSIMSSLFEKPPHQVDLGMSFCHNLERESSSFVRWRNGGKRVVVDEFSDQGSTSQKILKGILLQLPRLQSKQQEGRDPSSNHVLAERRRREKVNDRFSVLKSLLPSASKADKISILDDTIAHLKELERRVQELGSCEELAEYNRKNKRRPQDMEERTSDNYGSDINIESKKKKGVDNINHNEEVVQECNQLQVSDSSTDNTVAVCIIENDISIDIRCPWKDSLFLQILDKLSSLHLDSHSVQSSTSKGILSLKVKSTVKSGCISLSVGLITQELQRVLKNG